MGDFDPLVSRAYRWVLSNQRPDGRFAYHSRANYGVLSDRRSYPRYLSMMLFHLLLEAEYRRDITKNWLLGFVVFVNANTVTQADNYRFTGLHPATGAGLRIKFNKRSGTNIAFDYGVSKYGSTFSLNLGEAF